MTPVDAVPVEVPTPVGEALAAPLVDHHCHGVRRDGLDRAEFELLLTQGRKPAPPGTTHFDTPVGLAVRRWCAPALGLDPHAAPSAYLARRAELGPDEVNRRLLRAAGFAASLVDTGRGGPRLLTPAEMGRAGGGAGHEIVRLEQVAQDVVRREPAAARYAAEFEEELNLRARRAVALKSIIAYRGGLAVDPMPPEPGEVVAAVSRVLREGPDTRLTEPVLLRHALWSGVQLARERKLPVQFHVGYGDTDLDLHRANPLLLTPFIRAVQPYGVPVVLLGCYPYVREAGYLAAVFPHVYLDVGLAVVQTAAGSAAIIRQALELAPFHKNLFGSDGYGLAELCLLGAVYFRRGLGAVLAERVAEGEWSAADAARVARLIGADNARRLYRLRS